MFILVVIILWIFVQVFPETYFYQREAQNGAREIWVRWRCSKIPDKSNIWKYHLDIDIHCLRLQEVEIMVKGNKIKADKGEVEVNVKAVLEIDYDQAWKSDMFNKYKEWYLKNFLKKKFELMKNTLKDEGFIYVSDTLEIDNRLTTLVEEIHETVEIEIARILFKS